ncbi:MAG: heme oxygenase (biliverdin-producing) [Microcystaceae cyanobacterium]
MTQELATQLRHGTAKSHTMAENTAFMKCFLKGIVEPDPFRQLLANFYFVYSTLESELARHQAHPVAGKIYFPVLNRKEQLEQDLAYYYGDNWQAEIHPSDAGNIYVERLKTLSETTPELLVSHAYVRYLGDLSGGQGLKRIVRSAIDLPQDKGTQFYEFDQLPDFDAQKAFKMQYRDALNSLPIDETTAQKIVEEANYAFELNRNIMHELEGAVQAAIGDEKFQAITNEQSAGSTE